MSRIDVSKLPPPSESFMLRMDLFRRFCADERFGRQHPLTIECFVLVLNEAPQEFRDMIEFDLRIGGFLPASNAMTADGEPVFTTEDLARYYCIDMQTAKAAIAQADAAVRLGQ